jgi:beta-phosphoglucomutase-like phosphatase (HAD superfamily)
MRFDAVVFDLAHPVADSAVPALSALIGRLISAGLSTAAVWTDLAAAEELAGAGLGELFDLHVGAGEPGAARPPEPDAFLLAARRLGVRASRTVVLATTPAGAAAGRAGAFGLVIGIGRGGRSRDLRAYGADQVVAGYAGVQVVTEQQLSQR